jgi:hypothetical protein
MLNSDGAEFDNFVWLETINGGTILFVEQVKFSQEAASTTVIDNNQIFEEYDKVKSTLSSLRADFVFIILCRRNGKIDPSNLPENTVFVCNSELQAFYGDSYYQRFHDQK